MLQKPKLSSFGIACKECGEPNLVEFETNKREPLVSGSSLNFHCYSCLTENITYIKLATKAVRKVLN